jgi:hypothetical protein
MNTLTNDMWTQPDAAVARSGAHKEMLERWGSENIVNVIEEGEEII